MAEYTFNVQFNVFFPLSHLQSVCNQIVIHSGYTYVSPVRNICDPDQNIWLAKMVLGCLLLKPSITFMIHRGSKGTGANAQWIWSAGTPKQKTEETLLKYNVSTLHKLNYVDCLIPFWYQSKHFNHGLRRDCYTVLYFRRNCLCLSL